jgi:hypothetical protein
MTAWHRMMLIDNRIRLRPILEQTVSFNSLVNGLKLHGLSGADLLIYPLVVEN